MKLLQFIDFGLFCIFMKRLHVISNKYKESRSSKVYTLSRGIAEYTD